MIDRIVSHCPAPVVVQRLAGVRVDIKPGKVAAGNIQPDSVSFGEYKGRWIHPDLEPIDLPRLHRRRLLQRIAIPRPHDAIRDVQLDTGWKVRAGRVDINQLGRKVRIDGARGCPKSYDGRARLASAVRPIFGRAPSQETWDLGARVWPARTSPHHLAQQDAVDRNRSLRIQ